MIHHAPIHIGTTRVLSHRVRVCTWNPTSKLRVVVRYNRVHLHTTTGWAKTMPRTRCAMNGGTYNTHTYIPSGNLWAMGHRVKYNNPNAPAVGFVHNRLYFGYANARRHGAVNIMNGLAMLVRKGVPLRTHNDAPWTTPSQFNCGGRGTDGWYGCFRSCAVQYKNGRYGIVEIALSSMPVAARILKKLNVLNAITFDSGGSAEIVTPYHGSPFGSTAGTSWHRLLPDTIIVQRIK